jgi:hypothetical protein
MRRDEKPEAPEAANGAAPEAENEAANEAATEAAIESIVAIGRRTRKPTPRWLWIAAIVVGAIAAGGFAAAMFAEPEPSSTGHIDRSPTGAGLGSGLLIGVAIGIVIGFAIARQRRDHSSRSSP